MPAQTIESRLVRDRGDGRRGSTTLPNVGKNAITHISPLESLGDYTLVVECRLETGRTHQIRIHLAESGHPLCGEKVYRQPLFRAAEPDRSGAPRCALMRGRIGVPLHPVTGEAMQFEMPLSEDLANFAKRLQGPVAGMRAWPRSNSFPTRPRRPTAATSRPPCCRNGSPAIGQRP